MVSLLTRFSTPGFVTVTATTSAIAAPFCRLRMPLFTTAVPVNVFAPLSVNVPVPVLSRLAAPLPLITPLNVVVSLLPPVVSRFAFSVTLPAPARLPMTSLLRRFSVPFTFTITLLVSTMAAPFCRLSVPPLTTVAPL